MRRAAILAVSLAVAGLGTAQAHHGWSSYDSTRTVTYEAPIVEASYTNPHGTILMEVEGATWTITLAPPSRMTARGLSAEALAVGETVTVEGYVSRVQENELRAERITVGGETVELR